MIPKNKKKKNDTQSMVFPIILGLLFVAMVSFLVISDLRINQKRGEMLNTIDELQQEIDTLESQKEELESGLIDTEDATYWEGKLREQGYKKPGEEAVVVLPSEETEETQTPEKSFWQRIKDALGI